ncbi:hypothetical protein [Aquisalimonas sp.]|uniref:hypothetical protein n=1 Tax=Aquisalimonas sp. TaxID=1872621 RepID=UPI0025BF7B54|nr:hypothetical protein [Aquisalimonas sp.]
MCERRLTRRVMQLLMGYLPHLVDSAIPCSGIEIALAKGIPDVVQLVCIVDVR